MTVDLASSTMQTMAIVFMTVCVTLRGLSIIGNVSLLVSVAMGAVLLACAGILANNVYLALVMFTIHLVSGSLVMLVTRSGKPCRILRRRT